MRLTINEYANKYKMSLEMVHSKIRAKKINSTKENGIEYIIVNNSNSLPIKEQNVSSNRNINTRQNQKTTVGTILSLYQKENQQLKFKIKQLEEKIDSLIHDKEDMLRQERDRLESVYIKKDEQLKTVLELINTKLMFDNAQQSKDEVHDISIEDESKAIDLSHTKEKNNFVELKSYLKTLDLTSYEKKIIKKRFRAVYGSDIRVTQQNGNFYLNFDHYDYSDLLEKP